MGTTVKVWQLPVCDFHRQAGEVVAALYDGATIMGPWANMCEEHFHRFGVGLGTGRGQRLLKMVRDGRWAPVTPDRLRLTDWLAVAAGTTDYVDDACERIIR